LNLNIKSCFVLRHLLLFATNNPLFMKSLSTKFPSIALISVSALIMATSSVQGAFSLLDVDFGDGGGSGVSLKTGYAAIGQATNDFWNFYDRSISPGVWRPSGALVGLKTADGVVTSVGMSVSDAAGAYGVGSSDPMYQTYVYPLDGGVNVVTFTNLPAGQYDVLAYSVDGNYEVTVGGTSYGVKTTADPAFNGVPVWTEGVQYARFRNVAVGAGQPLVLTVRNGVSGYAILAGLQILSNGPPIAPPPPTNSLLNVDFGDDNGGGVSSESGFAAVGQATNDFWNFYDRSISPGVWRPSGALVGLKTADGVVTSVGMSVSDAPGAWGNSSSDPMYQGYDYPLDGGNNVVTFTNLPAGQYDVLAYSQDGNYEVTVDGTSYGIKTTDDPVASGVPVWTEGVQYARFRNVAVGTNQSLSLTVRNGTGGYAILSGIQILSNGPPITPPPPTNSFSLLNLDFGEDQGGGVSLKTGYAAIGQATNDFWNFYDRSTSPGVWRTSGALVNLKTAGGEATAVGMSVSDAPGAYGNGSSDPMYGTYDYPLDNGNNVVTFTNLPAGQYDVLAYSQDGNYEVTVGGTSYGVKTTADPAPGGVPVWTEGVQYARFRNVAVGAGQPLALTVRNGVSGYAILSGIQILGSVSTPPPMITSQPTNQTVAVGGSATFNVTASGIALAYQWSFNTTNLVGATNATLMLNNIQFAQAGNYAVQVSNVGGATLSSNAVLTVNDKLDHFYWSPIPSPRFVNVPIAIAIQALDATNGICTNFTNTIFLTSFNGIRINPPITAAFVQGAWSGSIIISQPATNLFLWAVDRNGGLGRANAIDIDNPPTLGLALSGHSMSIYWPVASSNFVLETSPSLSSPQWVQVANPPFETGSNYLESIPMDSTNQFYRLHYILP
jgi:hypothetical protein